MGEIESAGEILPVSGLRCKGEGWLQRTCYTVALLFSFRCSNCGQEPKRGLRHGSGMKTVAGHAAGVAVLFFPFLGFFPLHEIGGRRRGQPSAPFPTHLPSLSSRPAFPRHPYLSEPTGLLYTLLLPFWGLARQSPAVVRAQHVGCWPLQTSGKCRGREEAS